MLDTVRVVEARGGALAYAIPLSPEALPAVSPAALLGAWHIARDGADAACWGRPRTILFRGAVSLEIGISDPDAAAWAEAIDRSVGLDTLSGLALCLRLLALVEVLGRARWLAPLYDLARDGIELHPRLVAAAATLPLDPCARLDEAGLRRHLALTPALT